MNKKDSELIYKDDEFNWKQRFAIGIGVLMMVGGIIWMVIGLNILIFHKNIDGTMAILMGFLTMFFGIQINKASEGEWME